VAAPLHPGFPQTGQHPTRQEYKAATGEAAARNAANRAVAQSIRDKEINASRPKSYKDAAQQPATNQPSLQQQLIQETAKRQALQADHEQRLKRLEADVQLLRQALTPSRSAPLESVTQPVKDIKPPLNQAPAQLPKAEAAPATPVAAPRLGDNPSGGASGSSSHAPKFKPNHAPPGDKRGKGPKALLTERPSTHGMLTRKQVQQQTAQQPAHAVAVVAPASEPQRPVVPDYWEDSKLGSGWVKVTNRKTRKSSVVGALKVATAAALAATASLPSAHAFPTSPVAASMEEPQEFWAQVAAAAAIWVCFVLSRHLARGSSRCRRTINTLT
jgi:hypothetical protein